MCSRVVRRMMVRQTTPFAAQGAFGPLWTFFLAAILMVGRANASLSFLGSRRARHLIAKPAEADETFQQNKLHDHPGWIFSDEQRQAVRYLLEIEQYTKNGDTETDDTDEHEGVVLRDAFKVLDLGTTRAELLDRFIILGSLAVVDRGGALEDGGIDSILDGAWCNQPLEARCGLADIHDIDLTLGVPPEVLEKVARSELREGANMINDRPATATFSHSLRELVFARERRVERGLQATQLASLHEHNEHILAWRGASSLNLQFSALLLNFVSGPPAAAASMTEVKSQIRRSESPFGFRPHNFLKSAPVEWRQNEGSREFSFVKTFAETAVAIKISDETWAEITQKDENNINARRKMKISIAPDDMDTSTPKALVEGSSLLELHFLAPEQAGLVPSAPLKHVALRVGSEERDYRNRLIVEEVGDDGANFGLLVAEASVSWAWENDIGGKGGMTQFDNEVSAFWSLLSTSSNWGARRQHPAMWTFFGIAMTVALFFAVKERPECATSEDEWDGREDGEKEQGSSGRASLQQEKTSANKVQLLDDDEENAFPSSTRLPATAGTRTSFRTFQFVFLLGWYLCFFSEWLNGTVAIDIVVEDYKYVPADDSTSGSIYSYYYEFMCFGFATAILFGVFIGSVADVVGRKQACLGYCVLHGFMGVTFFFNNYWVLAVGQLVNGIATRLLYSVFEAWYVSEHLSRGYSERQLSTTLSWMFFGGSLCGIAAGQLSELIVQLTGEGSMKELWTNREVGEDGGDSSSAAAAGHFSVHFGGRLYVYLLMLGTLAAGFAVIACLWKTTSPGSAAKRSSSVSSSRPRTRRSSLGVSSEVGDHGDGANGKPSLGDAGAIAKVAAQDHRQPASSTSMEVESHRRRSSVYANSVVGSLRDSAVIMGSKRTRSSISARATEYEADEMNGSVLGRKVNAPSQSEAHNKPLSLCGSLCLAFRTLKSDYRVVLLGLSVALFEGSMNLFICTFVAAMNIVDAYLNLPEAAHYVSSPTVMTVLLAGYLLGSCLCNSLVTRLGNAAERWIAVAAFALGALGLFLPALVIHHLPAHFPSQADSLLYLPDHPALDRSQTVLALLVTSYFGLFLFEVAIGSYFPVMGSLKAALVPEEIRATLYNIFYIPSNLLICLVLCWHLIGGRTLDTHVILFIAGGAVSLGCFLMLVYACRGPAGKGNASRDQVEEEQEEPESFTYTLRLPPEAATAECCSNKVMV